MHCRFTIRVLVDNMLWLSRFMISQTGKYTDIYITRIKLDLWNDTQAYVYYSVLFLQDPFFEFCRNEAAKAPKFSHLKSAPRKLTAQNFTHLSLSYRTPPHAPPRNRGTNRGLQNRVPNRAATSLESQSPALTKTLAVRARQIKGKYCQYTE